MAAFARAAPAPDDTAQAVVAACGVDRGRLDGEAGLRRVPEQTEPAAVCQRHARARTEPPARTSVKACAPGIGFGHARPALGLLLPVGLGVGIQHGDVAPPDLNVSLSGLHIVAYTTDPIECRLYLPCLGPSQDYYVVGVYRTTAPDNLSETGHRILTVPLQR